MPQRFAIFLVIALGAAAGLVTFFFIAPSRGGAIVEGHDVNYWIEAFTSDDVRLRAAATRLLPQFGAEAAPAIVEHLGNPASGDRAAEVLLKIDAAAVPALIQSVRDRGGAHRIAAIELLAQIGKPAASARSLITPMLRDNPTAPAAAAYLAAVGPDSEALALALELLDDSSATELQQCAAVRVLAHGPTSDPRIEAAFRRALRAGRASVRADAFDVLAHLEPPAVDAAPDIVPLLQWLETRDKARALLFHMGSDAIPALRQTANYPVPAVRIEAVSILGEMIVKRPGAARAARDALLDFTHDASPRVADFAEEVLQQSWKVSAAAARMLLHSQSRTERLMGIAMLASAQPLPIDDLLDVMKNDTSPDVRLAALNVLADAPDDDRIHPALTAALNDPDEQISRAAHAALIAREKAARRP